MHSVQRSGDASRPPLPRHTFLCSCARSLSRHAAQSGPSATGGRALRLGVQGDGAGSFTPRGDSARDEAGSQARASEQPPPASSSTGSGRSRGYPSARARGALAKLEASWKGGGGKRCTCPSGVRCRCGARRSSGPQQPLIDPAPAEGSREAWWRGEWLAARNADALRTLARMGGPGAELDARTSTAAESRALQEDRRPPGPCRRTNARPPVPGRTAASLAAERGDAASLRCLGELGADLAVGDAEGFTPLHYAAEAGHEDAVAALAAALQGRALDAREALFGATPLLVACACGQAAAAEELLARGADLQAVDDGNVTAAGWCKYRGDGAMLARVLAAAGPGGCRPPRRGDQKFRLKKKELEAQLMTLDAEQTEEVAEAWGAPRGSTASSLASYAVTANA